MPVTDGAAGHVLQWRSARRDRDGSTAGQPVRSCSRPPGPGFLPPIFPEGPARESGGVGVSAPHLRQRGREAALSPGGALGAPVSRVSLAITLGTHSDKNIFSCFHSSSPRNHVPQTTPFLKSEACVPSPSLGGR